MFEARTIEKCCEQKSCSGSYGSYPALLLAFLLLPPPSPRVIKNGIIARADLYPRFYDNKGGGAGGGEERRGGEGMEVNYAREKTRGLNIALDGVGLLTGERYYLRVE